MLVVTSGEGLTQEWGKPVQEIRAGDVVWCPPGVKHWHGAIAETGMQQLYIIPNTEKGIVEWNEKVTEEEYLK